MRLVSYSTLLEGHHIHPNTSTCKQPLVCGDSKVRWVPATLHLRAAADKLCPCVRVGPALGLRACMLSYAAVLDTCQPPAVTGLAAALDVLLPAQCCCCCPAGPDSVCTLCWYA
jgi:hypothetical protein